MIGWPSCESRIQISCKVSSASSSEPRRRRRRVRKLPCEAMKSSRRRSLPGSLTPRAPWRWGRVVTRLRTHPAVTAALRKASGYLAVVHSRDVPEALGRMTIMIGWARSGGAGLSRLRPSSARRIFSSRPGLPVVPRRRAPLMRPSPAILKVMTAR